MMVSSENFFNYIPRLQKDTIRIVNGSFIPISRTSFVVYTRNIKLFSILHIFYFLLIFYLLVLLSKHLTVKLNFCLIIVLFTLVQKKASSAVHSDCEVGLERAMITGFCTSVI